MSNMNYCRFQNTYQDLYDCYENDPKNIWFDEEFSENEAKARDKMIKLMKVYLEDMWYTITKEESNQED